MLGHELDHLPIVTGRSDNEYITSDPRQAGVVGGPVLAHFKIVMDFQRNKVAAMQIGNLPQRKPSSQAKPSSRSQP